MADKYDKLDRMRADIQKDTRVYRPAGKLGRVGGISGVWAGILPLYGSA